MYPFDESAEMRTKDQHKLDAELALKTKKACIVKHFLIRHGIFLYR